MPRFSIVLPCYNAAATLPETLASIRAQTLADWELICIDDGSEDDTARLLKDATAADGRIRLVPNPSSGPSAARNVALSHARADIIAFCDADDLWAAHKLERLEAEFKDPSVAASYARVAFFDGDRARSHSTVPQGDLSIATLLGENPVCTMSNVAVRRDAFRQTGGFDTDMVHNEDLEWLIRLVGDGHRVTGIDDCLVQYRTSHSGLSADLAAMRAGRDRALATAARYGHVADRAAEAVYARYLARRALRVGAPGAEAFRLSLHGIATSPRGFFSDLRRGLLTAAGACAAPLLPAGLRRTLFAS
ncbi:glycosyltransferase family A protein [Sulfitobacter sp. D35]|uniref:glycosyltransferase family 2 protein n=1 Tax=Sulfitobacter sp. D35 TaxID=3083252 RepID=UPI00296EF0D3|nr:glycosyltransferase family A protein [Sulfitobacter sp. D35]MDW4498536.1 glycosyltransferase family A protein [Sulfitobacter sp. D35]